MTDDTPYNDTSTDRLSFKDKAALAALQSRLVVGATPADIATTCFDIAEAMDEERKRSKEDDADAEAARRT